MAQKGKITVTNMIYGLGAAIVIVGALFKIQHWPYGSEILTLGMIVEALVFTYSAFERQQSDLDWSLVYPELAGGMTTKKGKKEEPKDAEGLLSKKLDSLLKDAKMSLDAAQMESLNSLYKVQMESASRQATINEEAVENATKLKEQMQSLASNLSSLNGVYGGMLSAMNKN